MAIPRGQIVNASVSGVYLCSSSCAQQADLCRAEQGKTDRREWILDSLKKRSERMLIDVLAVSVMETHMDVVLKTNPELAAALSTLEVVERWFTLHPSSVRRWARLRCSVEPGLWRERKKNGRLDDDAAIAAVSRDAKRVEKLRSWLTDLGKLLGPVKQGIARIANKENGKRGHFWDERFQSIQLLTDAATIKAMIHTVLNPVRAGIAETLEESDYTSVQDRIHVKQYCDKRDGKREKCHRRAWKRLRRNASSGDDAEAICWLAPIRDVLSMTLECYLQVVDTVGRLVRREKCGAIPPDLAPILDRLNVELDELAEAASFTGRLRGNAAGSRAACEAEGRRRSTRSIRGNTTLSDRERSPVPIA